MKKLVLIIATAVFITTTAFVAVQQNQKSEASEHPRIEKAIHELEGAIEYMEKAPHDFGGHKAEALEDSRKAVKSLKLTLAYRAHQDNKKGK
jgi:hypothetical protein